MKRIYTKVKRRITKLLKLHLTSYPYVSGDTFRAMADHIYDTDLHLDPTHIQDKQVVFVQSFLIDTFFQNVHPNIHASYILITHNGDKNIDTAYIPYFNDKKIIHWFAQNCQVAHPKLTPIPIGIENKSYFLHGIPKYFTKLSRQKTSRELRIFYKFNPHTNISERTTALHSLQSNPLARTDATWHDPYTYLSALKNYAFVASPPGNGEDCIRTWEALYLRTVPVVKHSAATEYFASLGLPLWVIKDWGELDGITENDLVDKYDTLMNNANLDPLHMDFWIRKINTV